jgi:hypothetical protein
MPKSASDLIRAVYPLALVTGLALTADSLLAMQPRETQNFLRNVLHFTNTDLRHLAEGRAAVRTLETSDDREVAIVGGIRVPLSPQQYVAQLRNIVEFKRHEAVRQIGTFSTLPQVDDIAGLTLDEEHLEDLRECRLHDCDVQLSSTAIARVQQIDWSASNANERANQMLRDILTELVTNYRRHGEAALMVYEDERRAVSLAAEFRAMVSAPTAVLPKIPVLHRHIVQYPLTTGTNHDDVIYWSKENVGPKVVVSVTHLAILPVPDMGPIVYAAASKQLYGSYYFDTSLGLTLLLRDDQPDSIVLVYMNRSRIDELDGFLGGLKRALVRSKGRSALEDTLARIQTRLPARVRGAQ